MGCDGVWDVLDNDEAIKCVLDCLREKAIENLLSKKALLQQKQFGFGNKFAEEKKISRQLKFDDIIDDGVTGVFVSDHRGESANNSQLSDNSDDDDIFDCELTLVDNLRSKLAKTESSLELIEKDDYIERFVSGEGRLFVNERLISKVGLDFNVEKDLKKLEESNLASASNFAVGCLIDLALSKKSADNITVVLVL